MNSSPAPSIGEPPEFSLEGLAADANTRLEDRINEATQQAFNLGCLIGLLPAVVFGIAIFLATGFSLIGTAMAAVIGVVSAIAFANLAAMITRRNTLNRAYRDNINPEIEKSLMDAGISREDFDQTVRDSLPQSSPLYGLLPIQSQSSPDLSGGES